MTASSSVSVIIPAYNAERYVGEAIESVLAQTSPPGEVIVVDDGSTDGTAAVAESFGDPVICIRREHAGLAATFNAGLAGVRGELLACVDADDLWAPNKLELQLAAMDRDPDVDLVFAHVEEFLSPELTESERSLLRPRTGAQPGIVKGAMLARTGAFRRVGEFDSRWKLGEFIDWYARAQEAQISSLVLPDVLLRRRLHSANSSGVGSDHADYARMLGEMMKRRRGRPVS